MSNNIGKVVQVIGPVVDDALRCWSFASHLQLIHIYHDHKDTIDKIVVEVMQHLGDDTVRLRCDELY